MKKGSPPYLSCLSYLIKDINIFSQTIIDLSGSYYGLFAWPMLFRCNLGWWEGLQYQHVHIHFFVCIVVFNIAGVTFAVPALCG